MAGLVRNRVGQGSNNPVNSAPNSQDRAAAIYSGVYPELEKPATSYASTRTPLSATNPANVEAAQLKLAAAAMPPIVDRHERRDGQLYEYAYGNIPVAVPQMPQAVFSSHFQPSLTTLHPWMINTGWYICYPAATVMNGGKHNLGLSEKTPQVSTRISGGPGTTNQIMNSRPRFSKVQRIPRYPTGPSAYKTKSAGG